MRALRDFAHELIAQVRRDRTLDLAAQFAYWSLLAFFPFCIFLLTLIGYIPLHGLDRVVVGLIDRVMPAQAAAAFDKTLHEVVGRQRGWLLIVSLAGALWSATGGMSSTLTALNRAYAVEETRPWWRRKVLCTAMTAGGALLMIVATIAAMIGPGLIHRVWIFFDAGGDFFLLWRWARWPIVIVALMLALALVYHFLPNVKQPFRVFTPGAAFAIIAWVAISGAFNLYVSHFKSYAKTYGTLGAAVVLLTWLYLTGLAIILGGEINAVVERRKKRVAVVERERAEESAAEPTS